MAYWEYEMTRKECEKIVEEEKKRQEEQETEHRQPDYKNYQRNTNRMMRNIPKPSIPPMPRMPKI